MYKKRLCKSDIYKTLRVGEIVGILGREGIRAEFQKENVFYDFKNGTTHRSLSGWAKMRMIQDGIVGEQDFFSCYDWCVVERNGIKKTIRTLIKDN